MPVRRTSQNWGQLTTQPNELYSTSNDIFWGSGLQFGDTHEQSVFSSNNNYELFLSNYDVNLQQAFNPETYGGPGETHHLGYLESSATTMHPSFVPTPLPVTMGIGFLPLGESPSDGSDANWQSSWESEVDVDLSMRVRELQLEYAMPSTSNSAAGPGEPKKWEGGTRMPSVQYHLQPQRRATEAHSGPTLTQIVADKIVVRRNYHK